MPLNRIRTTEKREVPADFIRCPREDLIILISRMLNTLIPMNDGLNQNDSLSTAELTRFHSRTPPGISVHNYLSRLARYSSLENAVLLAAVYYIDLLTAVYRPFTINSLTVHRFLLTVTTVGSKGLCDSFCTNTHYAKVGGIQPNELDILEREFLQRVKYRVLPRDLNIERCAADLRTDLTKERKNSLGALDIASVNDTDEVRELEEEQEEQEKVQDFNNVHARRNAGFTILERFYKHMVKAFGDKTNLDEAPVAYLYTIDPDYTSEGGQPTMINTEADTISDDLFQLQMRKLLQELHSPQQQPQPITNSQNRQPQSLQNSCQSLVQALQVHSATSSPIQHTNGNRRVQIVLPQPEQNDRGASPHQISNGSTAASNTLVYPKSPLKRPNPDAELSGPSGIKRSAGHV